MKEKLLTNFLFFILFREQEENNNRIKKDWDLILYKKINKYIDCEFSLILIR
jgi:hypothetical protein